MESIQESYVFSKNDLYINYDKFESGKSNICLITGLSGSGKSTLAEQIASKNKAEWIELDIFEHCNGFTDDQLKEAGQVFYDYLSAHKDIWDKLKKKELHGKDLEAEVNKFTHYCVSWCKKNKSKKWIIEGVQIYSYLKFEEIKSYPIVIKNTSMLKSIIQRWKRNGDGKIDLMEELRNEFPQLLAWHKDEEKALNDFRKSIIQESKKQKPYAIITDDITVTKSYGYTSPKNGIYNAIVDVNASIRARGRSELLVIKGDEVYLSKSKPGLCGGYSLPGGGWDPNEPHDKSAIREAEEEARLKTKNVVYADRYLSLYDEPHDWIKREIPEEYQWRGYYTEVYVGEYAGKYSGKIEDEDKDDIIKTGRFYKIKEVFDELHPIHQNAILNYLSLSKTESSILSQKNSGYLNVQDCMVENAGVSYSSSFSDIKDIADSLSDKEFKYIFRGSRDKFTPSKSTAYRKILKVNNEPVSFVEVYRNGTVGLLSVACKSGKEYRHKGYTTTLVNMAIEWAKNSSGFDKLEWFADKGNGSSNSMAKKMGFELQSSNNEGNTYQLDLESKQIHEEYVYYGNKRFKKVPKSVKLYHGSRVQGLKELVPKNDSISRIGNISGVYATKDKRFAACYGTAWRDDIAKQGSWDNWDTVVMGISDKVEMDNPCSLYELENDGSFIEISNKEVVSTNTIKVRKEHKYSSYREMLKQNGVRTISYDNYKSNVGNPNPVFEYLDESIISEASMEFIAAVMLAGTFGIAALQDLKRDMKAKSDMEYYITAKQGGRIIGSRYNKPVYALLNYAYGNGIHHGESDVIFVDDSNRKALSNAICIYGKSKTDTKLIKSGTLESLCKSYGIKVKEIDKSISKERLEVIKKATSELRSKLPNIVKSKGKFIYNGSTLKDQIYKEDYDDFINGVSNSATVFYVSLWDIDKEARTNEREGLHDKTIWEPLNKCLSDVSNALPKGYSVENVGDWDDIFIGIVAPSIKESTILEIKRSELDSKEFGLPDKRKYPLTDAKHVKSAIKFFNYVDADDEAELARNIKRKAKEFGVPIRCGKQNRLSKYINKEYVSEFMAVGSIGNNMYAVNNGNIKQHVSQGDHVVSATDSYPFTKKEKKKKKDPVDGRMSVYMGDGEKLTVNESAERVPIYIIAYDYKSIFAGALKAATHSQYNHIAIALTPDLEHAYTFARTIKGKEKEKGFAEEPLSWMIKEHGNFRIKVNAVYVPKSAYDKISTMIKDYKKHQDDTNYNYGNLVRGAFGVKVDNDDLDSDSMNCSIFVDYMLKNAGVDITGNPNSNLVFPEHLANADENNDNVVTVYYGNAKGYNKKKTSKMKFIGESGKVKPPKKCCKCGSSNIGVFIKGEPVFLCKDCGAYNGTVPFKESVDDDDTFFADLEKQFEDLEIDPIPTDIFNETEDQG